MKRARIREEARKLNPIDDLMFRKLAEEKEFCEEILRVILEDEGLVVLETIPQWSGTNLKGRSVIMDAKCVTGDGRQINVEVQKADDDNHQKRVRYHGAVLTTNVMEPGEKFEHVPDVCVVFISRFDVFDGGLPLYHVDRVIRETKKVAANGFEEVYVNASVRDESRVSKLMEIFVKDSVYDEHFPRTTEGKQRYKETEGGLNIMCEIMERIAEEERKEGREEGIYEKAKEVARKMLKAGKTLEEIELFTGLTAEELGRIEKGK